MLTIREFAEAWLSNREKSGRYKRTTLVQDRHLITRHILPALGDLILTEVTPADIKTLSARLCGEVNPLTGRPKVHTARRVAVVLRRLLDDAAAQDLLRDNPARRYKLPSVPQEQGRVFSLDEIERLLAAVRDDYKPFVLVAMLTGARFGEIRELRWKDIDFERGWVHIRRQRPTHEGESIRPPKWDSIRAVEIMDPVRQVLGSPPPEDPEVRITRQTGHRNLAVFFRHYAHEIQRKERKGGTLSREETYRRLMAAFKAPADPERVKFLSVNQAANALGVSWGWLFELVRRGKVPATKRGQWLIPRDALTQIRLPRSHRRHEGSRVVKKR